MERPVIALAEVRYRYGAGGFELAADRLEVPAGLTLLVGPNGSGKSTLMRLLAGVERPDAGRVTIDGRDAWTDEVAARAGLAWVPEHPDLTPYASVEDVLRLVASLRRASSSSAAAALERAGLAGLGRRSVRELSTGQQRRAMFAAAFIGEIRTALLDEPLEALDAAMRDAAIAWISGLAASGATVVVATHDLPPFAPIASRVLWVIDGRPRIAELPTAESERRARLAALAAGEPAPQR